MQRCKMAICKIATCDFSKLCSRTGWRHAQVPQPCKRANGYLQHACGWCTVAIAGSPLAQTCLDLPSLAASSLHFRDAPHQLAFVPLPTKASSSWRIRIVCCPRTCRDLAGLVELPVACIPGLVAASPLARLAKFTVACISAFGPLVFSRCFLFPVGVCLL